ncbi:hypothetical protein DE146DRAFT_627738 [Phaeosphaeria sp. MPI-PUGE-AT-0046c]|nr:hypothetical protein DE146DRAFT_627738 [Phaeosphaeria sp. MPI-PUGE-AT-0046c]
MTHRHQTRSKRTYFPFISLPADVQLLVLRNSDLHTLYNIAIAVPGVEELLLMYPSIVWQVATTSMSPQFRNLLLTTFRLVRIIKSTQAEPQPDLNNMEQFLDQNLNTDEVWGFETVQDDPLGALEILCGIDAEVDTLVRDYAQQVYECACECDNPGAVISPLVLSPIERHRLTRAFYRLKLFGMLFYHYPTHFGLDLESSIEDFFATLSTFEIDEMIIAYHFLQQNDRYFQLTYMQKDCSCAAHALAQDDHPGTQKLCGQGCAMYAPKGSLDAMQRQFMGKLYEKRYSNEESHWALPYKFLVTPQRSWDHLPESNDPGAGWLLWCKVRDDLQCGIDGEEYLQYFSRLGYCFWDATRLDGWVDVFSEMWFKEERRTSGYFPWCDSCCGPCDITR